MKFLLVVRILFYLGICFVFFATTCYAKPRTTVKNILKRVENPRQGTKTILALPYAFSSESMGLTLGVGFRAVGNEPGWHLEITPSEKTVFVTDYGEFQHSVNTPQPVTDQNTRKTTYNVENAEHDLTVEILGQSCEDTMSGEIFEATVTVKLDGKTYKGCGKALH